MVTTTRSRVGTAVAAVVAAAGLVVTANGYRTLARRGRLSVYAFVAGLLATELPLRLLAVQAAALAAVWRWLSPTARRFGLAAAALSWLGLAGLARRGRTVGPVLAAALDPAAPEPAPVAPARFRRPGLSMLLAHRDYVTDAGIAYGEHGFRNTLDIWRRPGAVAGGGAPVLVQIHGGAWIVGQKRGQAHPLLSHLAERGWVCVSINYRLSPQATWPDHLVDVKRALAWTRDHIADYGGDPDRIALTGGSAGGQLCALAALTAGDPRFQPGFEDADTSVAAAVPFYGIYDLTGTTALHPQLAPLLGKHVFKRRYRDDPQAYRLASPIARVHADAPPFLVLHGSTDSLVPVEQARQFTAALAAVSAKPVRYAELPGAQHAFDVFGSARAAHTVTAVEAFLTEHLGAG